MRWIQVTNQADQAIVVYWIGDAGPVRLTGEIYQGDNGIINTYTGHKFEIQYAMDNGISVPFTKGNVDEHISLIRDDSNGLAIVYQIEEIAVTGRKRRMSSSRSRGLSNTSAPTKIELTVSRQS